MQHKAYFIRAHTVCRGKNDLQTKEYNILFENYNLTPLDMYNGLSQVYCIKPGEESISIQRVKGLSKFCWMDLNVLMLHIKLKGIKE